MPIFKKSFLVLSTAFFMAIAGRASYASDDHSEKNVLFLVDCSDRLWQPIRTDVELQQMEPRSKTVQRLIEQIVDSSNSNCSFGVRIFGAGNDCQTTELVIKPTKDKAVFKDELSKTFVKRGPTHRTRNAVIAIRDTLTKDLAGSPLAEK
ncbi:MAG TPA: hypothetical protein V6C86_00130, partial [Oculatellaceae cyanobacterium]